MGEKERERREKQIQKKRKEYLVKELEGLMKQEGIKWLSWSTQLLKGWFTLKWKFYQHLFNLILLAEHKIYLEEYG